MSGNSVASFNNTTAASAVTQDATVKAERDHYFDASVDQVILPGLRVRVDAYYKQATNLIDEGQFGERRSSSRAIGKAINSAQFNFSADELAYIRQHYIHLDHDQRWTGSDAPSQDITQSTFPRCRRSTSLASVFVYLLAPNPLCSKSLIRTIMLRLGSNGSVSKPNRS